MKKTQNKGKIRRKALGKYSVNNLKTGKYKINTKKIQEKYMENTR